MRYKEILSEKLMGADETSRLAIALQQISNEVKDTATHTPVSLTGLLRKLRNNYDVHFNEQQFRDLVTKSPVNGIISRIEGDDVIFIGQRAETSPAVEPDKAMGTIKKMAKRAEKKRD